MRTGRPTKYTLEIAKAIAEKIADGHTLKAICVSEDMPARSTVYLWFSEHKEFSDMYARATSERADLVFDEIFEIADDSTNDFMGDGALHQENIQRSKLRIDTRKWALAKMNPRKYGEAKTIDHQSSDGSMTPQEGLDVSKLSVEALKEIKGLKDAQSNETESD